MRRSVGRRYMRGVVGVGEGRVDGVEEVVVEGVGGDEDGDERLSLAAK